MSRKRRLPGAGRPLKFEELDQELATLIRERRSRKLRVSRRIIMQEAEKMFVPGDEDDEFKVRLF